MIDVLCTSCIESIVNIQSKECLIELISLCNSPSSFFEEFIAFAVDALASRQLINVPIKRKQKICKEGNEQDKKRPKLLNLIKKLSELCVR